MKLEREIMKLINNTLSNREIAGEIVYWTRINSGKVKTYYGSFIKLADKGNPDFIAVVRDKSNGLSLLFIEAKSDTGKLSVHQRKFRDKYVDAPNIYYHVCRDIDMLNQLITKIALDRLNEIII